MCKALDCVPEDSDFELLLHDCILFSTNPLGKIWTLLSP